MALITHLKRLWGIRHIRAALFCYRVNTYYDGWREAGFIAGWTKEEIEHWKAMKEGKA